MGKTKLLTKEEALALVRRAQAGDEEARELLVQKNIRLIWNCVHRFNHPEKEDLFQIGVIAMLYCIDNYDLTRDLEFSTYVATSIKGRLQTYLRDNRIVKIPRPIKDMATWIRRAKLDDQPEGVILEKLKLTESDRKLVRETIQYMKLGAGVPASLDSTIYTDSNGSELTETDRLEGDINGENWESSLINNIELREAISHLPAQDRQVIELRYFKHKSQREAAQIVGLSQAYVSRREKKALKQLKVLMQEGNRKPDKIEPRKGRDIMGNNKNAKGNREEAIRLLQETEMSAKEISKVTGVPDGSMGALTKKYRSPEVTARIIKRARQASAKTRTEKKKNKSVPTQAPPVQTTPPVSSDPQRVETLRELEKATRNWEPGVVTQAPPVQETPPIQPTKPIVTADGGFGIWKPAPQLNGWYTIGGEEPSPYMQKVEEQGKELATEMSKHQPKNLQGMLEEWKDEEVAKAVEKVTSKTNVEYNFNFNVKGEMVSVDEVIAKLDELKTMLSHIPVDAVNFRVNVGS